MCWLGEAVCETAQADELCSLGTEASAELGDGQGLQEGYSPQEALELALLDWVAEIKQQVLEAGR